MHPQSRHNKAIVCGELIAVTAKFGHKHTLAYSSACQHIHFRTHCYAPAKTSLSSARCW